VRPACFLSASGVRLNLHQAKRAETRKCPVCDELIPLRLLATHSELELERVEEIIKGVGSTVVMLDEPDEEYVFPFDFHADRRPDTFKSK